MKLFRNLLPSTGDHIDYLSVEKKKNDFKGRYYIFIEAMTFFLVLLFAYTGLNKLIDHNNFEGVIWYAVGRTAKFLSWFVIISELLIIPLLIIPKLRYYGFIASGGLMLLFTLYVASMIIFAEHKPCSCGGIIQKMTWNQHLIFNTGVTLLTVYGILILRKHREL